MATAKPLYKRSPDGRTYQCVLDNASIPDGAILQGVWDVNGNVVGVRVVTTGNVAGHTCGTVTSLPSLATKTNKWAGASNG
jgi:hypothetical protein